MTNKKLKKKKVFNKVKKKKKKTKEKVIKKVKKKEEESVTMISKQKKKPHRKIVTSTTSRKNNKRKLDGTRKTSGRNATKSTVKIKKNGTTTTAISKEKKKLQATSLSNKKKKKTNNSNNKKKVNGTKRKKSSTTAKPSNTKTTKENGTTAIKNQAPKKRKTYTHIRTSINLLPGHLKRRDYNFEENECDCKTNCDSSCLNFHLKMECTKKSCRFAKEGTCGNTRLQKKRWKKMKPFDTKDEARGFGLKIKESCNAGEFVTEYIGEIIDKATFKKRLWEDYHGGTFLSFFFSTH